MISFVAAALLVIAGASVDIDLAPDQPLSQVYADEPLIIEFKAKEDVVGRATLELEGSSSPKSTIDLGDVSLRGHGARWYAVDNAPPLRGRFQAHIVLKTPDGISELREVFCRIDRPGDDMNGRVVADAPTVDSRLILALINVPIKTIRLDIATPELPKHVEQLAQQGFQVVVGIDLNRTKLSPENLAEQIGLIRDSVHRWEITPSSTWSQLDAVADVLRRGGAHKPVAVVVHDVDSLGAMLAAGQGRNVDEFVLASDSLTPKDLVAFRSAAERAGYEAIVTHAVSDADVADSSDWRLARNVLLHASAGVSDTRIESALIHDGQEPKESYAYLSAISHRLGGAAYVGPILVHPEVTTEVFCSKSTWIMVMWSNASNRSISIPVGSAVSLSLTDALNNPVEISKATAGKADLQVNEKPVYLSGVGGDILMLAAAALVKKEAAALLATLATVERLPIDLAPVAAQFANADAPAADRNAFFALLKTFPIIEEQWHAGLITRSTAVPVLAGAARLARTLCVLEEEKGEAFIDPLSDTLGRCGEYQSLYITGAAAGAGVFERGEWLLAEVGRLLAESKRLVDSGRSIEGQAVASLAEWRARSLEHAAKAAPLSQPEPPRPNAISPVVSEPPPRIVEKKSPDKQPDKPQKEASADSSDGKRIEHVVTKGQYPSTIAKKYKVSVDNLMKWNGWKKTPVLHIGDKVVVFVD